MRAITTSAFRARMKYYLDSVADSFDMLVIPRGGKDDKAVVIIALEEYNALQETNFILSNKANREWLRESLAQEERGEIISFDPDTFSSDVER